MYDINKKKTTNRGLNIRMCLFLGNLEKVQSERAKKKAEEEEARKKKEEELRKQMEEEERKRREEIEQKLNGDNIEMVKSRFQSFNHYYYHQNS